jgi:hypothetical protein
MYFLDGAAHVIFGQHHLSYSNNFVQMRRKCVRLYSIFQTKWVLEFYLKALSIIIIRRGSTNEEARNIMFDAWIAF